MYFSYGETELSVLKSCDVRMAAAIEEIGIIKRKMVPDLFTAMVHSIISQQISNKARDTIWGRLRLLAEGVITPERILNLSEEKIRSCGISARKAAYFCFLKLPSGENVQYTKLPYFGLASPEPHQGQSVFFLLLPDYRVSGKIPSNYFIILRFVRFYFSTSQRVHRCSL